MTERLGTQAIIAFIRNSTMVISLFLIDTFVDSLKTIIQNTILQLYDVRYPQFFYRPFFIPETQYNHVNQLQMLLKLEI